MLKLSPSSWTPLQRLLALLMACAIAQPWAGPAASVVFLAGLIGLRRDVEAVFASALQNDSGRASSFLGLALFVFLFALVPPGAIDDVLRDLASSAYHFDYARMYPHANIPRYDAYWGFDHLLADLSAPWGPAMALHIVQMGLFLGFITLFWGLARRAHGKLALEHYALIAWAFFTPLSSRILLARPEVILTLWGLSALLVRTRLQTLLWALAGLVLTPLYWLSFLYLPFAFALPGRWRSRLSLAVALGLAGLAFWCWLSQGAYLSSLWLLHTWPAHRVQSISETQSAFRLLMVFPFTALCLLGFGMLFGKPLGERQWVLLGLFGYFLLSGMNRYAAVWVGLLMAMALPGIAAHSVRAWWLRLLLVLLPMYAALAAMGQSVPWSSMPRMKLPADAYVLTPMNQATFAVPLFNAGQVRVAPSMELGANTTAVQKLAVNLAKGELDCAALRQQHFTVVVESSLHQVPSCLQLLDVWGPWRAWSVKGSSQ